MIAKACEFIDALDKVGGEGTAQKYIDEVKKQKGEDAIAFYASIAPSMNVVSTFDWTISGNVKYWNNIRMELFRLESCTNGK